MIDAARPELTPEVLSATVWDAVKAIPGVVDLYRNPLQSLSEKVGMERHGPVRLLDQQPPVLEVHLVVEALRRIVERAAEGPAGTLDEHVGQRRCHGPRAVRRERDGHRGLAGYRGRVGHRFQR